MRVSPERPPPCVGCTYWALVAARKGDEQQAGRDCESGGHPRKLLQRTRLHRVDGGRDPDRRRRVSAEIERGEEPGDDGRYLELSAARERARGSGQRPTVFVQMELVRTVCRRHPRQLLCSDGNHLHRAATSDREAVHPTRPSSRRQHRRLRRCARQRCAGPHGSVAEIEAGRCLIRRSGVYHTRSGRVFGTCSGGHEYVVVTAVPGPTAPTTAAARARKASTSARRERRTGVLDTIPGKLAPRACSSE